MLEEKGNREKKNKRIKQKKNQNDVNVVRKKPIEIITFEKKKK